MSHRTLLLFAALVACSGDAQVQPSARDSAGVAIVEVPASFVAATPTDTLGDPLWTLGTPANATGPDMSGIHSAVFSDTGLVLADQLNVQLLSLTLEGVTASTGAGRGSGPGEMPAMGVLLNAGATDDDVWVLEYFRGLLHRYDSGLKFLAQHRLTDLPGGMRYGIVGARGADTLIAFGGVSGDPAKGLDPGGGITRPPEVVEQIVPGTGRVDTLFFLAGEEAYRLGTGLRRRRFGMSSALVVTQNGFVTADGQRWEVRWLDQSGALRRIVRVDRPRRSVTDSMRAALLAEDHAEIDGLPPGGFPGIRRMAELDFADPRFPDSLPAFDRTLGDRSGAVWFREGASPIDTLQHWLVFGPEALERVVVMPSSLTVLSVHGNQVLSRREDSDGIGYIALHQLVARTSPAKVDP